MYVIVAEFIEISAKGGATRLPVLVLFYAPWCGFFKQLKPEYAAAATELKGHSILAAIDVNRPENAIITQQYNITGFPIHVG
jgi:protein disulfide-isomerase/protein disulfide isomerase family A protein 5